MRCNRRTSSIDRAFHGASRKHSLRCPRSPPPPPPPPRFPFSAVACPVPAEVVGLRVPRVARYRSTSSSARTWCRFSWAAVFPPYGTILSWLCALQRVCVCVCATACARARAPVCVRAHVRACVCLCVCPVPLADRTLQDGDASPSRAPSSLCSDSPSLVTYTADPVGTACLLESMPALRAPRRSDGPAIVLSAQRRRRRQDSAVGSESPSRAPGLYGHGYGCVTGTAVSSARASFLHVLPQDTCQDVCMTGGMA